MTVLRTTSFPALGTTAVLVAPDAAHDRAVAVLEAELEAIDSACSRFRADSELAAVNRSAGSPVEVSELFLEALDAALSAARLTSGLVDPTVGRAMRLLGYDRDFAAVAPDGPPLSFQAQPVPGWTAVVLDRSRRTVRVPAGVELDFGATAKALCADRAARRSWRLTGEAVLVSLGGDIAVAGPAPDGGWAVGITDDHAEPLRADGPAVSITSGGLATSSTVRRRWRRGATDVHHVVDPRTGEPAVASWRTVSVAAGSCLDANVASCAALVMGPAAAGWLEERSLPARLVGGDGRVVTVGGWPVDEPGRPWA